MKRSCLPVASLASVCLVLGACASPRASRISEHATLFSALSKSDQDKIQGGLIDIGFQQALVYMAIGRPSKIVKRPEPESRAETWHYHNFVYAPTSAATVAATQTGARYEGRQLSGSSARGGVTSTPRSGPTGTVDDSVSSTATLLIDLVEGRVVRIRLEP